MVEIIPKPTEKMPAWQNILFYLSFIFLLVTVFAYFLLGVYLKKDKVALENLKEALRKEKTAEEIALEEEISTYQKKIGDFAKLANQHLFSSKSFEFIEKNTHPQVWFSRVEFHPETREMKLTGETENFVTLAQQIQIFRNNSTVKNFYLTNIEIGKEGKVNFNLNLNLDPDLFK